MSAQAMPLTVSLGIASWPADGVMGEEIIASADAALYRAKQTGRNRTCLSSEAGKPEVPSEGLKTQVRRGTSSIVYALAATVDAKDRYTYGHSKKVSEYAVALAQALALSKDRIDTIRAAALLHDIGKIGIPDAILNKEGTLTAEEWEPVKAHPKLGTEILRHVIDLVNCLPAILHHHERYDGTGYPSGLKGSDIPLEARILAVADAYDAITSLRPYHGQLSPRQALAELKRNAGTQFDPELVDIFCKIMEPAVVRELEIK
jgi:putative nucleotidyltransferase with HDIG domain